MSNIWVIAAESGRARILETHAPLGPLREIESLVHPAARNQERELISDKPGRSFDSRGEGRHAMEAKTDAKHQEAITFARQIADRLEQGRIAGEYDELVLVAAPAFLGLLRQNLTDATADLVSKSIDKNVVRLKPEAIREQLE